jgi:hypothetical protein
VTDYKEWEKRAGFGLEKQARQVDAALSGLMRHPVAGIKSEQKTFGGKAVDRTNKIEE